MLKKLLIVLASISVAMPLMLASGSAFSCCHKTCYQESSCYKPVSSFCNKCSRGGVRCGRCVTDGKLACRVVHNLRNNLSIGDTAIRVTAHGHRVCLSGRVGTPMQRYLADEIARNTCGTGLVVDSMIIAQP